MIKIYTDAAYRMSTGEGGLGLIIEGPSRLSLKFYVLGVKDNHQVEFMALELALKRLFDDKISDDILTIYSDSKILVDSIEKKFVKDPDYKYHLENILDFFKDYSHVFVNWIPDRSNKGADHLARQALNKQGKFETIYAPKIDNNRL